MVMSTQLEWEVMASRDVPGEWRVEAIGEDGECYLARFYGPDSEERAREYAEWLNMRTPTQ